MDIPSELIINLSILSPLGTNLFIEQITSQCLQENMDAIMFFEVITRFDIGLAYNLLQALTPIELSNILGELTKEQVMEIIQGKDQFLTPVELSNIFEGLTAEQVIEIIQGKDPIYSTKLYKQLESADITYLIELAHLIRSLSGIKTDDLEHIKTMFRGNLKTDMFSVMKGWEIKLWIKQLGPDNFWKIFKIWDEICLYKKEGKFTLNLVNLVKHIEEIERFTRLSRTSNIGQKIYFKHTCDKKFYEKLTKQLENQFLWLNHKKITQQQLDLYLSLITRVLILCIFINKGII